MASKRQRRADRRKAVDLSQEQLAERLGRERSPVGRCTSPLEQLDRLLTLAPARSLTP